MKKLLSISDNDQYKQLFIEEAKEHIETLTKSLLNLEKDPENKDLVNMLFRSAHTLKGSSGMMGFKDFQELTHSMEDIFDHMRQGDKPTSNLVSTLLECVDTLSERLDKIQNNIQTEIDVACLKKKLDSDQQKADNTEKKQVEKKKESSPSCFELDDHEKETVKHAESSGGHGYFVEFKFSNDCAFKNIRANMLLSKIQELSEVIKTIPSQKELDEKNLDEGFKVAIATKCSEKEIENCAHQVCEVEKVNVTPMKIDGLIGNKQSITQSVTQQTEETKIINEVRSAQTVRVKFDQLDKLMNWVGELVINKIALIQVTTDNRNESLKRITENIDRLTSDLQDLVMQVRMVPVSQIFDRFPRMVRDLSLANGKKIDLVMEGKEIEVDRTVLDEIGEPLIHLLRNSIDHGIESIEERKQANKPITGKIKLSAQRNGDTVIIHVEDDGVGIDPEKIKASAIKKGFSTEAELAKMSREQIVNMIFLPGFSTVKQVTETSGRGVGMDVVKTKITALGGSVHFDSQLGKGTKTMIKLPLTLAIIQAILVKDSGQTFAIPTSQVSEIVRAKRNDVKSLGKKEAIIVRDKVIPVEHLHKLLGFKGSEEEDDFELLISYIGDEETKLGLVVDSVVRQQDVLIKTLSDTLSGIKGISGATILGDGQVVLVLDVAQFTNRQRKAN